MLSTLDLTFLMKSFAIWLRLCIVARRLTCASNSLNGVLWTLRILMRTGTRTSRSYQRFVEQRIASGSY
jgi:hypothetical protein